MKYPRVSIIIPLKDTLPYFKKCCDSLMAQTCSDIEIIVVDDASSQDISGFLNSYGYTQKLIYLRNEVSLGPGACRNQGLDIAQGQYISFCDSDDWVDLNYYEHVCNHLDKTTADLVMVSMKREFPFRNIDDETYMCRYSQHYTLDPEIAIHAMCGDYDDVGIKVASACMNKIYRHDFLQKINARFEEGVYFQGTMFSIFTFCVRQKSTVFRILHITIFEGKAPLFSRLMLSIYKILVTVVARFENILWTWVGLKLIKIVTIGSAFSYLTWSSKKYLNTCPTRTSKRSISSKC